MRLLRRVVRAPVFVLLIIGFFIIRLAGRLVSIGHPARDRANRYWVLRHWSRASLALFGFRRTTVGAPPPRPALIVANHLSYLDILALSSVVDAVFVTKLDVQSWPVIGFLVNAFAPIYINRESIHDVVRVSSRISDALERGESVILFAEGTSSGGEDILPLRASLLQGAAQERRPVHVASLTYATADHEPHPAEAVCWWRDMELLPHLFTLLEIRNPSVLVTFGEEPVVADDRKALARQLRDSLRSIFAPVNQYKASS